VIFLSKICVEQSEGCSVAGYEYNKVIFLSEICIEQSEGCSAAG